MKNKITKTENGYTLTLIDGREYPCKRWYEKKVDKWHVMIPVEAREICGRTYIRESFFDNSDIYEFENKTEHREGLGNGGWKSRLTEEELKKYNECEKTMNDLKTLALSRQPRELTELEKTQREYEKILKRLETLKALEGNQV